LKAPTGATPASAPPGSHETGDTGAARRSGGCALRAAAVRWFATACRADQQRSDDVHPIVLGAR
jgi:hypothetical protein